MSLTCNNKQLHFQNSSENLREKEKDFIVDLSSSLTNQKEKCSSRYNIGESTLEKVSTESWINYVGDCKAFHSYLQSKCGIGWLFLKFPDAILRGISQVVFANNPITGLLILIALFWADATVGVATVFAASLAIITAFLLGQDLSSIQAGLTTYNAVLVGSVTASLWTPIYNEPLSLKIWIFIAIGSILSVFVTSAIGNLMSSFKIPLPALTLPFNIVNLLLFTCLKPTLIIETNNVTSDLVNNTTINLDNTEIQPQNELDYAKMFSGIIISMGQVYGVENIFSSILMYVGILIYSPILCLMGFLGATIGNLFSLCFIPNALYTTVYSGIWGYNGILSATAIGGFFIVLNVRSFWTAIMNTILTIFIQQGLVLAFHELQLPVFTLPFVLSTFMFLSISSNQIHRVANISFPEMHLYEFNQNQQMKKKFIENEDIKNANHGNIDIDDKKCDIKVQMPSSAVTDATIITVENPNNKASNNTPESII